MGRIFCCFSGLSSYVHLVSAFLGAVAWTFDDSILVDGYFLNESGHLVVNTDLATSVSVGDDSSIMHIIRPFVVTVGHQIAGKTVVYPGATLALAEGTTTTISATTHVLGNFSSTETNKLIIDAWVYYTPHILTLLSLEVQSNGNLTTIPDALLTMFVPNVLINGNLNISFADFKDLTELWVGELGAMEYTPVDDLVCDEITINGTMAIRKNVIIRGRKLQNLRFLHLGSGAMLVLDQGQQLQRNWTGVSVIGSHQLTIGGHFLAGLLALYKTADGSGMDFFLMTSTGHMEFEPHEKFLIDHINIQGHFESYTPLELAAMDQTQGLFFLIKSGGEVILDSSSEHPHGPWTGYSSLTSGHNLTIEEGGDMHCGLLNISFENIIVAGYMGFDPGEVPVPVKYLHVNSSGKLVSVRHTSFINFDDANDGCFHIDADGLVNLDFMCSPENESMGCPPSQIMIQDLMISGTLKAGTLQIQVIGIEVTSSGLVDVSRGGHLPEHGPGDLLLLGWCIYLIYKVLCYSVLYI